MLSANKMSNIYAQYIHGRPIVNANYIRVPATDNVNFFYHPEYDFF